MMALQHWFTLLMSQWLVALPWLMAGVFCSSALMILTPRNWWENRLPKNAWLQLLLGILLGLILPVGQYGSLPVTRRLLWQSGSSSLAIAFWLSAVSIHPLILWQIWHQLPDNHEVFLFYTGLSLLMILVIGGIFTFQTQQITHENQNNDPFKYPAIARPSSYRINTTPIDTAPSTTKLNILATSRKFRLAAWLTNTVQELWEWSLWLFLGCGIVTAIQLFYLTEPFTTTNNLSVLGMGLFASISSFNNAIFSEHWLGYLNLGASVSFLLVGAFFSLQTILLLLNTFRIKTFTYLCLLISLSLLLCNFWLEFYVF